MRIIKCWDCVRKSNRVIISVINSVLKVHAALYVNMPPPKKIECTVVLFDVNSNAEFKNQALQWFINICGRKLFSGDEDLIKLVLINTAETKNKQAIKTPGKFKNIVDVSEDAVLFDPKLKTHIEEASSSPGNWLEGVLFGVTELENIRCSRRGVYSSQLVLLSDLETPLTLSDEEIEEMIENIVTKMNEICIYTLILGPEVVVPKMLCSKEDIRQWVENITFADGNENTNRTIAKKITEGYIRVMCDLKIGSELYFYLKNPKGRQAWNVPLTFKDLEIPASTSKFIEQATPPSITRESHGFSRTAYVSVEDDTQEVSSELVVDALALHGQLIYIPKDVDKGIKEYDRFFKLLGFTDSANIPEHYMMATSTNQVHIYCRELNAPALETLIRAAKELDKYGVALKAHMKNCRPKLYCLIPEVEDDVCYFTMVELPYAEEFVVNYKETSKINEPEKQSIQNSFNSSELKETVYGFLDSIDIENKFKLHPNVCSNFSTSLMLDKITSKYLGEDLLQYSEDRNEFVIEPNEEYWQQLSDLWIRSPETQS